MMKLNLATVATLFRNELRMVLRDRRTVVTSIVLPLVVMPLMLFGSIWTNKKHEQKLRTTVYQYTVTGSQSNAVRELVTATRQRMAADTKTNRANQFRFEEKSVTNAVAALTKGDIHFVMEGLTADEARPKDKMPKGRKETSGTNAVARTHVADASDEEGWHEPSFSGAPVVRIVFRADRDDSSTGMNRMNEALRATRRDQRAGLLKAHDFPLPPEKVAIVSEANIASKGHVAGLALGRVISLFLLLFIFSGGAVVATDLIAGEKERGTLETLLTTGAVRAEIVAAKYLIILAVALVITLIQSANLLVYVGFKLIPVSPNLAAAVPPAVALLLLVLFLPMMALAAGVLLLTSGYAKSYKEAQLYFLPVLLIGMLPALVPFLPGLPLRSAIVLVPVANLALAAREILVGDFDWPMIALSWLVTAAAAAWTTRASVRFLSAEKLITSAETDAVEFTGGPALFGRRVLRWFAVLWALLLIINNYLANADVRVQLLINLVGLFFTASLLMLWRYRLDPRAALALRAPKPAVWLAVLIAIPGGLLTGIGLFHLADFFIPMPPEMVEGFSEEVMPGNIPFVQMLFFVALMPGFFEEIAFRGVLLHGLHRRLHPAALALVVGLVFGIFHVLLFRLVPTAFLGVVFASVTLLTGSIFPAMLWHAGNNTLGILAARQKIPLSDLDPMCYVAGAIMLAVAFWVIWRNRTPYPGLRPWRQTKESLNYGQNHKKVAPHSTVE
jgi:ABC-type Na+ efflux pump permease subunit/membrane protease YdiL (CAAX protease family)